MNREQRERLVEDVLDRALGPQLVEPRAGLEERILANLPAQPERRSWWQWLWIPALAAAAVLVIVIGMRVLHKEPTAPQQVRKTTEAPKQEVAVRPEAPTANKVPAKSALAKRAVPREDGHQKVIVAKATPQAPLPRQSVFPAPVPPTTEELALISMLQRRPGQIAIVAEDQAAEREKFQKFFETGEAPAAQPNPAQNMR